MSGTFSVYILLTYLQMEAIFIIALPVKKMDNAEDISIRPL